MAFGLLSTGFARKRLEDIKGEMESSLQSALGPTINLLPQSVLGQLIGILSEREALIWEMAEGVYNSQYPDTATDTSLDNAARITGSTRLEATFSTVTMRVLGTLGTAVPVGFAASVSGISANRFVTTVAAVIGAGINEVQTLTFSEVPSSGQFILNFEGQATAAILHTDDATTIQTRLNALNNLSGVTVSGNYALGFAITFAGADGEKNQPALTVTANTLAGASAVVVTNTETQKGFGPFADVASRAESSGVVLAQAGTLTVIETPTFGLSSVTNLLDAVVGRARETDSDYRLRRLENLQRAGTATVEGIRAALLAVDQVTQALVVENTSIFTDGSGRPPKSFEAYVQGGTTANIVAAIWASKPAGIETFGAIASSIIDSQGFTQPINFSRPIDVLIYLDIEITKNTDVNEGSIYPADGDSLISAVVLAFAANFEIGQDVITNRFFTPINTIPGVIGIVIKLGTAPNPTLSANISIGPTSIARFDSTRTVVSSV